MQYFGIVDIDFRSMTLGVYPYDARAGGTGSTEVVDLLDDVSPALLARGVPMRQVGGWGCVGQGLGFVWVWGRVCG
jgi:hypothetical protein